jgi:disulfide bond formation protein DsbB
MLKLASYCFSVLFLGMMGLWWSTNNAPNQFIKTFIISLFVMGTILGINMIKSGIEYHIGFYSVEVSSAILAFTFMFAKSNGHWFNTLFKMTCLINIIASITFFTL